MDPPPMWAAIALLVAWILIPLTGLAFVILAASHVCGAAG